MTKILFVLHLFAVVILIFICSSQIQGQTIRQVLDKFIASSGGKERISRITSSRYTASGLVNSDSIRVTMIKEKPNRIAMITDYKGQRSGVFFNKGKGVQLRKEGKETITDSMLIELLWIQSNILPEMSLDLRKQRIELDKDTVNEIVYNKLTVYSRSGLILYANYYHPQTGLVDITVDRYRTTTYYLDYRFYKGFNVPHSIRIIAGGMQSEMVLTAIGVDDPPQKELFD